MGHLIGRLRMMRAAVLIVTVLALVACGPEATPAKQTDVTAAETALQQGSAQVPFPTGTAIARPSPSPTPSPTPTIAPTETAAPTATATATPAPTPSSTPEPTSTSIPAAAPALSPSEAEIHRNAEKLIGELGQRAWEFLVTLTEGYSPRASATAEEEEAADFLRRRFEAMGYHAEIQPFTIEPLSAETPHVLLHTPGDREIESFPMRLTGNGEASGLLADAGRARDGDLPEGGLEGRIAIIERGQITFEEKVTRVTEAGAIAAVVYNNEPGLFGGRLTTQASVPVVAISQESGDEIVALMAAGEVEATVSVVMETRDSRNVIAELPGSLGDGKVVVLGAHYDTVPDTQGANDNGSGVATLMTVAGEALEESYPFGLRFIVFGSEEVGLFGSRHYVDSLSPEERDAVIAMLNFDVPGSGDTNQVLGNFDLMRRVLDYGRANGIEVDVGAETQGASSDHASFAQADIPAAFFLADDLSRINAPGDDLEFVKPELMGTAAVLGLGLLDSLAGR